MPAFDIPAAAPLRLIEGLDGARFYHGHLFEDIGDSGREARSVSNRLLLSNLPLDAGAERGVAAVCEGLSKQLKDGAIEPGQVDAIASHYHLGTGLEGDDGPRHPVLSRLGLLSCLGEESLSGIDADILFCLGASFHNDLHGWSDSLFVNWMVSGPEVDFVVPYMGGRIRIRPGDCFAFDPSQPHGLTMPGEDRFIPESWRSDASPCIFFSWVISLTPALDALMGIERGERDCFAARNDWLKLQRRSANIDVETGRIHSPFMASKSIQSSSTRLDALVPESATMAFVV